MNYELKGEKPLSKHSHLTEDFSESEKRELENKVREWRRNNPLRELTEYPQSLSWIIVIVGFGFVSMNDESTISLKVLFSASPIYLLSVVIIALASFIYFNNKQQKWKSNREWIETVIINEIKDKR